MEKKCFGNAKDLFTNYMKKKALIFGITGQDGAYLTKLLIAKGYNVFGVSRYPIKKTKNFKILNINLKKKNFFVINKPNLQKVIKVIKISKCDKIFFLSGITSVNYSLKNPIKTLNLNIKYIFFVLEACKIIGKKIKIYNSISSECFGSQKKISETSKFNPQSPYGLSKTVSYYLTKYYRETFNMWISNGILFNHESSLRPKKFVIKKIVEQIKKIERGKSNKILLGNTNISRDWGWAPEIVNFIYKISNMQKPDDFVIATGKTFKLKKLINLFLKKININKKIYVSQNTNLIRDNDIKYNSANLNKLYSKFKSKPKTDSLGVIWNIYNKKLF
jgi:GDPmannose 4,6-dehydratase